MGCHRVRKNRDRLLAGKVADAFFAAVLAQARTQGLSNKHFTVDGTLIEAWAGAKSFKRKDDPGSPPPDDDPGNPSVDFHGERRRNHTHQSTTDPEARLARKGPGKEAKLSYAGHVLMENRNGLALGGCVTQATGRAEVEAALDLVEELPGWGRVTLGCRQGLRPQGVCPATARASGHAAYRVQADQHHRPAHHPPSGLRHKSAQAQTSRRDLRLAQDGRGSAQNSPSRLGAGRLDVHLRAGRLQPGPNAQPAARTRMNPRLNCAPRPRRPTKTA